MARHEEHSVGELNVVKMSIGEGKAVSASRAHVADPADGSTVDTEARAAIVSILATLEAFGLHLTA